MITQVESLDAFGEPLTENYPAYTAGQVMLETAERLVVEEVRARGSAISASCRSPTRTQPGHVGRTRPPTLILDSYLLRALAIAGYAPSLLRLRALWSRRTASSILARNRRGRLRTLPSRGSRAARSRDFGVARCAARGPLA